MSWDVRQFEIPFPDVRIGRGSVIPGAIPLSRLHDYVDRRPLPPERVRELGQFLIRDAWIQPTMREGHQDKLTCYVLEFLRGDIEQGILRIGYSPARERVVELVVRTGGPIGPCELVAKELRPGELAWQFVGVEPDGTVYDPMPDLPREELSGTTYSDAEVIW